VIAPISQRICEHFFFEALHCFAFIVICPIITLVLVLQATENCSNGTYTTNTGQNYSGTHKENPERTNKHATNQPQTANPPSRPHCTE